MTVESLSHLEAIFDNEDIKESVRKIKRAYKEHKRISLPSDEIELVQQAYKEEMRNAEARTHALVHTFLGRYWHGLPVKPAMTLEGLCAYRFHNNPIVVVEDLTRPDIIALQSTDEELTNMITARHSELQTCKAHNVPVEVEKSFLIYAPDNFVRKIISSRSSSFGEIEEQLKRKKRDVIGITGRIKSPGDLADKITDRNFGIDKIYRVDKIPSENDEVKDLSGIRFITMNQNMCYIVLGYIKGRKDISIVSVKDYIQHPKNNGYKAINLVISYCGLFHEIQIVDTEKYDFNKLHPDAAHRVYRQVIKEAREKTGQSWFELNIQLRELFGLKPSPLSKIYTQAKR